MENEQQLKKGNIVFSSFLMNKPVSHKIAYLALFSALSAVSNLFEIPLGDNQISLTIFASAIIGVLCGGVSGFVACFIGDFIGFITIKAGLAYSPFVGLSTGLFAFFAGLFSMRQAKSNLIMYLKLFAYCMLTLCVCTVMINTLWFYLAFSSRSVSFFSYVVTRLFVRFQIVNNLVNYLLLLIVYPLVRKQLAVRS